MRYARSRLLGALVAVTGLAVGCGDNSTTETTSDTATTSEAVTDDTDVAEVERVVDDLYKALEVTDPQAASALFVDDGVLVDKNGAERVGTERIESYVETVGPNITHCERTGAPERADDGSYVFPIDFVYAGTSFEQVAVVTLNDDLIVRHAWDTGS